LSTAQDAAPTHTAVVGASAGGVEASHINLLVSHNTLMYFDAETQQRILASFRRVFAKVVTPAAARNRAVPQQAADPPDPERFVAEAGIREAGFEAADTDGG